MPVQVIEAFEHQLEEDGVSDTESPDEQLVRDLGSRRDVEGHTRIGELVKGAHEYEVAVSP